MPALIVGLSFLGGCATQPVLDRPVDLPPGVVDARSRFAGYFCNVLERHGPALPDYRPCAEALKLAGTAFAEATPGPELGESRARLVAAIVPGIGYGCIAQWLGADETLRDHLRRNGFDVRLLNVDALSGTSANARMIRDDLMALPGAAGPPRIVLIGYSKGTPDILDALVNYPEIRSRLAAVVSIAGAVGGSPLAEKTRESTAELFRHFPGSTCAPGDHEAVAALRPDVRRQWLEDHPLPGDVRVYTVATMPEADRISRILKPSYRKLARIDPRNDGQVITADQFVPGSTLLGFANADHWAVALPIARRHAGVGALFATANDYPREALFEAILRFVEDEIAAGDGSSR